MADLLFGRVTLKRIVSVSDIGDSLWCRWLNDRRVTKYLGSSGYWTPGRLAIWFSARVGSVRTSSHRHTRMYAILLGATPVGTLKLEQIGRRGCANIGLMIGEPKAWASGVATLALRLACRAAKKAGCGSAWAGIGVGHRASRRAFEEAGFRAIAIRAGADVLFLGTSDIPSSVCERISAWPLTPPKLAVMRHL